MTRTVLRSVPSTPRSVPCHGHMDNAWAHCPSTNNLQLEHRVLNNNLFHTHPPLKHILHSLYRLLCLSHHPNPRQRCPRRLMMFNQPCNNSLLPLPPSRVLPHFFFRVSP